MSTSDDLLVQRQLRAAEVALQTARRQRLETAETMRRLRAEADEARTTLATAVAAHEAEMAAAHQAVLQAEQAHQEERRRRLEVEQQLTAARREVLRRDVFSRELAAEARVRALEGEFELVMRRAAEFEQAIRVSAGDVLRALRARQVDAPSAVPDARGFDAQRLDAALDRLRALASPTSEDV